MTHPARQGEWFEAIPTWSSGQRRIAKWATLVSCVLFALPLALWCVLPPAPTSIAAPMPEWNAKRFANGESMQHLERHFKETSWVTFGLRSVNGELRRIAGFPPTGGLLGQFTFETASGEMFTPGQGAELFQRGFIVDVPWPAPRPRTMIAPNQTFWLCYRDNEVLRRDWFDSKGRVKVRINQFGLREREDLLERKPAGQQRVLCIGDSLTFGWGVPEELGWVRLLEDELRRDGGDVRTINCGGTMAVCADEYGSALEHRFGAFEPDVVVVTLCLNDLIPSNGLCLRVPPADGERRFADVLAGKAPRGALDLDPARDWVTELLQLGKEDGGTLYHPTDQPFEAMWSQGAPQAALVAMKRWCGDRKVGFVVTLWPFLQGFGEGRHYPFQRLHDEVAAFCEANGMPFVDVLPALRDIPQEDLWVTPADMHPNPRAHSLAVPLLAPSVSRALRD
jgi:hypothetical protein